MQQRVRTPIFGSRVNEARAIVEAHLRVSPNERIPVDSFAPLLGHPNGHKLTGEERTRVRLALNDLATKIAKKQGIERKVPKGGVVTNPVRNELFREVLESIRKSPSVEPNAKYFYEKYGERMFEGEKYSVFSSALSQAAYSAKKRLLKENPKIVFWDTIGKSKKKVNSFYVRIGAEAKLREIIRKTPNAQIDMKIFLPMIEKARGVKLRREEITMARLALAAMARRIAKELGIARNPPSGGARIKRN